MKKKGTQKPRAYLILSGDRAIYSSKAGTNGKAMKMSILQDWLLLAVTKSPILLNPIMSGWGSLGQNHHFFLTADACAFCYYLLFTLQISQRGAPLSQWLEKFVSSLHRDTWTCMEIPICFLQGLGKAPREQVPSLGLKSRFFRRQ